MADENSSLENKPLPSSGQTVKDENLARARIAPPGSEERFKLLIESVYDYAIFLLDSEGYIQSWNPGAQRFKGYTAQEAIGKHFSIFYTEKDIQKKHPDQELAIASKEGRFEEEGWRVRKNGTQFWANVVITKLTDSDGQHVGYAKVTRDLTQRMEAEERLKFSEERYRLLVSAVKDYAIFMIDPEGIVATWNDGAVRLKGYLPNEIIGQHFSKFYPEEDIQDKKPELEIEEATRTGRFEHEGWRVRKDGSRFWANVVLTAIRNAQGRMIGFSKVTQDMTDRKRLEEELRRSNEELDARVRERTAQLEKAIKSRDEFMSIISHELRTPVTSLKLQVQTALRQANKGNSAAFAERALKFVRGTGQQLDRLARLIDDMLDVSQISMDRMSFEPEKLNLTHVVKETIERFEDQCRSAGCPVTFKSDGLIVFTGDRTRLEQVFSNLLINAVKYGDAKPIQVTVRSTQESAHIEFQDQGIGIAEADQERIFHRFERAVSANSISGMGLGLYISFKIIEAHKGKISVRSESGKGSTFTVSLPLQKQALQK